MQVSSEEEQYYLEHICSRGDEMLRCTFFLCLNRKQAITYLGKVYGFFVEEVSTYLRDSKVFLQMLKTTWVMIEGERYRDMVPDGPLGQDLKGLSLEERFCVLGIDIFGIKLEELSLVSGWNSAYIEARLAKARAKLFKLEIPAAEQEFFLSRVHRYLDGELSDEDNQRIGKLEGLAGLLEAYRLQLGALQLKVRKFRLSDLEQVVLREKVRDRPGIESQEQSKLLKLEKAVLWQSVLRTVVLLLIAGGVMYGAYTILKPPAQHFAFEKPLDTLDYEAQAMAEESTSARLNLPSNSLAEVAEYLANSRVEGFIPRSLEPLQEGWQVEGASIIEYDETKIAVVEYLNLATEEKVFYFTMAGSLEHLPAAKEFRQEDLQYRGYSSERNNIIAWQDQPETLGILIGGVSMGDLAELAVLGSGGRRF